MSEQSISSAKAELLQPSNNINEDLAFYKTLGFRLNNIYPADNPMVALISGHGMHIRLDKKANCAPATIQLLTDDPLSFKTDKDEIIAPNGTIIKLVANSYQLITPPTQHKFEVRHLKDHDSWIIGRAGMLYRDLSPDRLGGSIIASHINIRDGGPVPDMVHYHTIGFQLIFCYQGWVKLVYEDQGPPFILNAGDCVTQPPEIRHRVLESSDNLEVIEIGVPAEHMTTIDHQMDLPNDNYNPDREFQGQKFCHHIKETAKWHDGQIPGFKYRDTGINESSNGVASVIVLRAIGDHDTNAHISNNADILFSFVMEGSMDLEVEGKAVVKLKRGDAFVLPPETKHLFSHYNSDLELLHVTLPGNSETSIH